MKRRLSAALLGFTLVTTMAYAGDREEMEKGRTTFKTRNFSEAEVQFTEMLTIGSAHEIHDKVQREDAQMYRGASQMEQGKDIEAEKTFEKLIAENFDYQPDLIEFSRKVLDKFADAKEKVRRAINQAQQIQAQQDAAYQAQQAAQKKAQEEYVAKLETMAHETVMQRKNSRWVALVPFGVGHFQNREYVLGTIALGLETVLFGLTFGTFLAWQSSTSEAYEVYRTIGDTPAGLDKYNQLVEKRVIPYQTANLILNASLFGVMILDVVLAQLRFVPEFHLVDKNRPLPMKPQTAGLRPTFGVGDNGGSVGLVGHF